MSDILKKTKLSQYLPIVILVAGGGEYYWRRVPKYAWNVQIFLFIFKIFMIR